MPRVSEAIREADFVAFDLEYTGINGAEWQQMGQFDNKDTIYAKRKQSAENFQVLQVGLCPFRWEPDKGHFKVSPFNFLICPVAKNTPSFLSEAASLKFLLQNKIDMMDSLNNGIPYVSAARERAIKDYRLNWRLREAASFQDREYNDLSSEDTRIVEEQLQKVSEWHEAMTAAPRAEQVLPSGLRVDSLTLLQRRVIVEALRRVFPTLVPITLTDATGQTWEMGAGKEPQARCTLEIVFAANEEEKAAHEARLRAGIEAKVQESLKKSVGFKQVVEELAQGPAFLVGHNCMLDLLHVWDKFGRGLPPTLPQFCADLRSHFPVVFDTKHMVFSDSSADMWGGMTSLYEVFKRTNNFDVPIKKADGFENLPDLPTPKQLLGTARHDGGLDAFTAGLLFARLAKRQGVQPGELRGLPELIKTHPTERSLMWTPRAIAQDGSERREPVRPLQRLARTANWLYAGMIYSARASFGLVQHGHVRSCRPEDDLKHKGKWGTRRPNVLLLWALPGALSDAQIVKAIEAQQRYEGHKIDRIDDGAALVLFPTVELSTAFWDGALRRQGEMGRGGLAAFRLESGREELANVETYGTFVEIYQSGIMAPSLTQAATWLGLDPLKPFMRRVQLGGGATKVNSLAQPVKGKGTLLRVASGVTDTEHVSRAWAKQVWKKDTNGAQSKADGNPVMGKEGEGESTPDSVPDSSLEQVETDPDPEAASVRREEEDGTTKSGQLTQLQLHSTQLQLQLQLT